MNENQIAEIVPVRSMTKVLKDNIVIARELKKHVVDNKAGLVKNGKRYIEFPEWQTLANAYDVIVETRELGEITRHGDKGIKACGRAVHVPTGRVVGFAEAMAFRDEYGKAKQTWNQIGSFLSPKPGQE